MACLTKQNRDRFLDAIRSGEITPEKMVSMSSKGRQELLSKVVGPENMPWVNAALESKIILKDQQRGMVSWAKNISGMTEPAKRDLVSMIQRQSKVFDPASPGTFLESLAAKRFGHEISFDEAKNLTDLARQEKITKEKINPDAPIGSQSRLEYGTALANFKDYAEHLMLQGGKQGPLWYLKHPIKSLVRSAGVAKSILSTLDNSFFGRQGIKTLMTNPDIWGKNFIKSWGDIGKELAGRDAMLPIKADVFSRPNALNGKYKAAKIDLGIHTEEAFPSHVLTKIPILGRLFKGAESAFNGAALRFRADLADRVIQAAEVNGVDTLNPAQAESYGRIINSITGRGDIGRLGSISEPLNVMIFSPRFLKSNFDALTAHQLQKGITPFARKLAAQNALKIVGSIAGVYTVANMFSPGSAELDPRSTNFGKIKYGNTTFDITGGMGSLATLAARMVPSVHDGKWGFWSKGQNGEYIELGTGKYGNRTPLDVLWDFTQGKFAPYAALLRDLYRGKDFQGNQTYVEGHRVIPNLKTLVQAHAPIPMQNFVQNYGAPDAAPMWITTILDEMGISANTITPRVPKAKSNPLSGNPVGGAGLSGGGGLSGTGTKKKSGSP